MKENKSYSDPEILKFWEEFNQQPINVADELEKEFYFFPKGTEKIEIWHWFDSQYSKGVHALIYGEEAYADFKQCEPLVDHILNVNLPEYIPKLKKCLENKIFKTWFEDKFCKWTQKVDSTDMRFLWENINTYLKNQEDFE